MAGYSVVADGARGIFDTAMIISADGDMASAVRELKNLSRAIQIGPGFSA